MSGFGVQGLGFRRVGDVHEVLCQVVGAFFDVSGSWWFNCAGSCCWHVLGLRFILNMVHVMKRHPRSRSPEP